MDRYTDEDVALLVESADRYLADQRERILSGECSHAQGLSALWSECAQMGWLLTCVPAEADGAGLGAAAGAALLEAAGRHLAPVPLAHGVAVAALLADASIQDAGPLAQWLAGERSAGVAETGLVRYAAGASAWRLTWADNALTVEWVGASAAGYGVEPLIPVASVADDQPQSTRLPCSLAVWQTYQARLRLLTLAEMLGAAVAALDLSVAYACEREQFGRPIGSNQAIKHRLADNRMALDDARLVLLDACSAVDARDGRMAQSMAMAELLVQEAAHDTVAQAIQTHGAMGITWECPVHFHFKRVKHLGACLRREADPSALLDRIWELAGEAA